MDKKLSLLLVVLFGITLIVNAQCVQCDGGESHCHPER